MTNHFRHQYKWLILIALLTFATSLGCVDDPEGVQANAQTVTLPEVDEQQELLYSLSSGRTPVEERLAGELESLLPGEWSHSNASAGTALDIIFLGHDAVNGDIAILMVPTNEDVMPTRITLEGADAILHLPGSENGYLIEHIDADRLELYDTESESVLVYLRETSTLAE